MIYVIIILAFSYSFKVLEIRLSTLCIAVVVFDQKRCSVDEVEIEAIVTRQRVLPA